MRPERAPPSAPTSDIEASSYWLATAPVAEPAPPVLGTVTADVAIVGGGLTGLWTALFLHHLAPERRVAVVEAERCGYGASGRNAGIAGETFDHSNLAAERHFGIEEARRLARLARENLDEMEGFLAAEGADVDFERTGQLLVALDPAQERALDELQAANERAGVTDWRRLDGEATRRELASPLYRGALLAPRAALLHPGKLVLALRQAVLARDIALFEGTRVERLRFAAGRARLQTSGGEVAAERVILATNAYSHLLRPRLLHRFLPLYDYLLTSRPLTASERAEIGWANRQGVTDLRTFFNYYRLTGDDRIVWGTSEAVYHRGNAVGPAHDHAPEVYRQLEHSFARHFPALAGLDFPYRWGGPIAATTRLTPFFGAAAGGRLLYGLGYTGHGLGSTRLAGKLLAHLAAERCSELAELAMARRPPFPYPPEPLRRWAVARVRRDLLRVDEGAPASWLLRLLDRLGIGFSS